VKPFAGTIGVLLLLVVVSIGCSEDPNSTGYSLLPGQDSLKVNYKTFYATADTTVRVRIEAVSQSILVGQAEGVESDAILTFGSINVIPAASILDSARLKLHVNYKFRDTTGNFGIEVRRMTRTITAPTWDSINVPGAYSDTISGRLLQVFGPQDTTISLPIDTSLVRLWIASGGGQVILLPTASIVLGLSYSVTTLLDGRPELRVSWHDSAGTLDSLSRRSASGSFAADGTYPIPADHMALQAGIVDRSIVHFDSLHVPLRSSVVQAILRIPVDSTTSLTNNYTKDFFYAYQMRKIVYPYDSLALGTIMNPVSVNGQKYYQADIRAIVQQWDLHAPNYGIQLKAGGETSTLDRFMLYGAGNDTTHAPRIVITYTLLP
jgi:hypothetical protein